MGFASGSVTFRRFAPVGKSPKEVDQELLDQLASLALRPGEVGTPEEVEYGWSGGRHVLDGNFSFDNNVYGDALLFALRIDSNKVPGELKKAYSLMEEEAVAATNPSGFISKMQKREVKDSVRQKVEEDLRSGRFRRSKMVPVLWDLETQTVYSSAAGAALEQLLELFERTFGLTLHPLSAGSIAMRMLEPKGRRRDYEDMRPTRFVYGPAGESEHPEYPWVAKGPEPKDFLGNEFLLWLWHASEGRHGVVQSEVGETSVMIDRFIDLDCAYGATGKDSLRGTGPHQMPEARDALRSGKLPRKAGLVIECNGMQFTLGLNPESFLIGSAKLPDVEEAENPRVVFEERIAMLRELSRIVDGLFESFLNVRASASWEGQVAGLRKWITQGGKTAAVAVVTRELVPGPAMKIAN
jgi:hypothetical protein